MPLIWWTNQADCQAIDENNGTDGGGGLPATFPVYLREQYRSRYGRNGRGRLWVDPQFKSRKVDPWPDTALGRVLGEIARMGQTYAGIVIRARDAARLDDMPGVITTMELRRYRGSGSPAPARINEE